MTNDVFVVEEMNSMMKLEKTCLMRVQGAALFMAPASLASLSAITPSGTTAGFQGLWTDHGAVVFVDVGKVMDDNLLFQICSNEGIQLYRCMHARQKASIIQAFNPSFPEATLKETNLSVIVPNHVYSPEAETAMFGNSSSDTSPQYPNLLEMSSSKPFHVPSHFTQKEQYTHLLHQYNQKLSTFSNALSTMEASLSQKSSKVSMLERQVKELESQQERNAQMLHTVIGEESISSIAGMVNESEKAITRMEDMFTEQRARVEKERKRLKERVSGLNELKSKVVVNNTPDSWKIAAAVVLGLAISHYIYLMMVT